MLIKCIVIDDQIEAIEILTSHINNKSELTLIKTFINPIEALSFSEKNKIDLVFIDVQMPHLNGLDFIIPKSKLPMKTKLRFKSSDIKIEIISSSSRLSPIKGAKLFEMYQNAILQD